ncbi:hypothetical protein [Roseobacter weihaiensis]|uniref:hypothetical protein n=1 Tax=Roseobacter weihaiensis TaxID=2763262 RepID=UPI001D0B8DFE|nr:hypothetical protein [Roseobacter sp. H9]
MDVSELILSEADSDILYIHFDVPEHHIRLQTFLASAASAQKIIAALNHELFDGELHYELVVLASEEGSFLKKLALWASGGVVSVFAFLESDMGKAYFRGLTGQDPSQWTEQIGESHAEYLEDVNLKGMSARDPTENKICSQLVIQMTKGLLEISRDDLESTGLQNIGPDDALDARSEFYEACMQDSDVRGVGFAPEHDFPIPRNRFPERAIRGTRKIDEEKEQPWIIDVENIYVTSPNWDKNDQLARHWKGKDSIRKDCYFIIEDDKFWSHVRDNDLSVNVLDRLKVQWAYQISNGRPKNRRVLRVLEFNDETLSEELSSEELEIVLGSFNSIEVFTDQSRLF